MKKKCFFIFIIIVILLNAFLYVNVKSSDSKINDFTFNYLSVKTLWDYSKGNSQTIAFIDTGLSHAALKLYKKRIVNLYNVINNNYDITDHNGHGTKMISIACNNSTYGVYGIAPECKIMPIKAIDDNGKIKSKFLEKAIAYAISNNATVINLSLGGYVSDKNVTNEIEKAINKGITVVAAAGDYGTKDLLFPANINGVISVEAKNQEGTIWSYSNVSSNSALAMPGVNINELEPYKNALICDHESGTSQSTALASGYIALIRDYYTKHKIKFNNNFILSTLKKLKSIINTNVDYTLPFQTNWKFNNTTNFNVYFNPTSCSCCANFQYNW